MRAARHSSSAAGKFRLFLLEPDGNNIVAPGPQLDAARVRRRYSGANVATELQPHASLVVAHFLTEVG
jgi:hypothetical protein